MWTMLQQFPPHIVFQSDIAYHIIAYIIYIYIYIIIIEYVISFITYHQDNSRDSSIS